MSTTQEAVNDHPWENLKPQRKRKPIRFSEYDSDDHEWETDYERFEKRCRKPRRNDQDFES